MELRPYLSGQGKSWYPPLTEWGRVMARAKKSTVSAAEAAFPPEEEPLSPPSQSDGQVGLNTGAKALLDALQAVSGGDFTVRLPRRMGPTGKIADTFNMIIAANQQIAQQLQQVGQIVGREGKTRKRARFNLSGGSWGEMESSLNALIDDLLWPTTAVTATIAAVAKGDLLQPIQLEVDGRPLKGEFLRSATIVNKMIKQLRMFTSETPCAAI
jgi:methyl-accepting chemotaxis protein